MTSSLEEKIEGDWEYDFDMDEIGRSLLDGEEWTVNDLREEEEKRDSPGRYVWMADTENEGVKKEDGDLIVGARESKFRQLFCKSSSANEGQSPSVSVLDRLGRRRPWYRKEFDRQEFDRDEIEAMVDKEFSQVEGVKECMGGGQFFLGMVSGGAPLTGLGFALNDPVPFCLAVPGMMLAGEPYRKRSNKREAYRHESREALRDLEKREEADGLCLKHGDATVRVVDEADASTQRTASSTADTPSISWQEIRDDTNLEENLGEQQVEFHGYEIRGRPCEFVERLAENDYEIEGVEARASTDGSYEIKVYGQHLMHGETYDSGEPPLRFKAQARDIFEFEEREKPEAQRPEAHMEEPERAKD